MWDTVIIVFAIINAFFLPLDIAHKEMMAGIPALVKLDESTVYIFFFDIILGFNTSYTNVATGEEVFGYKFIARHYIIHGTFLIDILSTFQLDKMAENMGVEKKGTLSVLGLLGFLKI